MANLRCPGCSSLNVRPEMPSNYEGTLACDSCSRSLRVKVVQGMVAYVRVAKTDLAIPDALPDALKLVLKQAVTCFDADCYAACLVMTRLFTEGLFKKAGVPGDRPVDLIEQAHATRLISDHAYHSATASRLMGNMGAHFSDELASLDPGECRTVLELVARLASELIKHGALTSK